MSHSTAGVSRSQHEDHSFEENSLAERPMSSLAATAKRTLAKKKQKRSRKSEENPVSPSSKKARIQTSEPRQDDSQVPTYSPNNKAKLSYDRPAEPHLTNAPLITPRGSRLVMYNKETADASPSKTPVPRSTTTTSYVLDEACAHLVKMEPMLKPLIEKHYCRVFCPEGLAEECDPFRSLCGSSKSSFPIHPA